MQEQQPALFSLDIDDSGRSYLKSAAKWNRFLAIAGIAGSLLTLLIIIIAAIYNFFGPRPVAGPEPENTFAGLTVMAICVAVFIVPCFFMLRFSNKMLRALRDTDQYRLNQSLLLFKIYSKYWGITAIISIALFILLIIIGVLSDLSRIL